MSWPIRTMPIRQDSDLVIARQCARAIAEALGFDRQDQTRIATAVSEIARNAFLYAGGGEITFTLDGEAPPQVFTIRITDSGPGIADLDAIFTGRYRSPQGLGLGLAGAKRLMDTLDVQAMPGRGTAVTMGKAVPHRDGSGGWTAEELASIAGRIDASVPADITSALRAQNVELMQALDEIHRRQDESMQLNKELGDTNRGVVALYAELEEHAEHLRRASELKSRFLAHMSHEFRTPLNSILALARMLMDKLDGDLNGEQERQVGYIRRSAESLLELVNDLLDLSKIQAGKVDVKVHPFTVTELFSGLRGALKPLLVNPAVELTFDDGEDIPSLHSDEGKIGQILRNLIANALKFTERGQVHVSAAYDAANEEVSFSVRDTGIGIAPADQERIFEEFTQVETKLHGKVKGTGLGLPLSRNLATLLGGAIILESVPGQGSVFRLVLPARFDETRRGHEAAGQRQRVLLIDDDEASRYVTRQLIAADPKFTPIEAHNGIEGLRLARQEAPAVIVLDLLMPDMDGFAVLRMLQADVATRSIPVVIATSLPIDADLRRRLPPGIPLVSKQTLSRESVGAMLRGATAARMH
jgi:signal transduction histidine kinase